LARKGPLRRRVSQGKIGNGATRGREVDFHSFKDRVVPSSKDLSDRVVGYIPSSHEKLGGKS